MQSVTILSVQMAFTLALVLGVASWFVRRKFSAARSGPPPFRAGRVPIWYYMGVDVIVLLGIGILFYVLSISNAMASESAGVPQINAGGIIYSMAFQVFCALFVMAIVFRRVRPGKWLGLRWGMWPLVFAIAPVSVVGMWALYAGLEQIGYVELLKKAGVETLQDTVTMFQAEKNLNLVILLAIAAAVVAPVCEEILFRGYLYPATKKFTGPWVAAICVSLVFAAAHGSLAAMFPLFILGLLLIYLYEATGSIWAPMAVHFLFNATTVIVQLLVRFDYIQLPAG